MPKIILLIVIGVVLILWGKHGLDVGHIVGLGRNTGQIYLSERPFYFYLIIFLWHFIPGTIAILYALFLIRKK